jgi:hypothetical protein
MAVANWPANVPHDPNEEGFQPIKMMLDPLKTEMEGGNVRLRSRPGDNVGTVGQTVVMTTAEAQIFRNWVKADLGNGTARFNAPVWLTNGFETKVCQFANGAPTYAHYARGMVAVSMTLRVYDV